MARRAGDASPRIVTGSPGVGTSALLGAAQLPSATTKPEEDMATSAPGHRIAEHTIDRLRRVCHQTRRGSRRGVLADLGSVTMLSRADVVAWVAAVYRPRDAEEWVTEGPAAFLVCIDDGQALLVRKRTGEYWAVPRETNLYRARSDRRLRHRLGKLVLDLDEPTGMIHDPSQDLTTQHLMAWLDTPFGRQQMVGQIIDRGWAFLAVKGPVLYGGETGRAEATLAVIKRTDEVWDLMQGWHAEAAYYAKTETGFRRQISMLASHLQPIAQIPLS